MAARRRWIRPWVPAHGRFKVGHWHPDIRAMDGRSGVYAIRYWSDGIVYYVGRAGGSVKPHAPGGISPSSLYDILTRHFRKWRGIGAGHTYDREKAEVAFVPCPPSACRGLERRWRDELIPIDNPLGEDPKEGEVPF